jgi:hypothetical protein
VLRGFFSLRIFTYHPASFDSFVDSINGVCRQGFFSFGFGDVIFEEAILTSTMIWAFFPDSNFHQRE